MDKKVKIRIDHLLVEHGLIDNPSKARARIMAGDVVVNDHRVDKPGEKFASDVTIRLRGDSQAFVSRGGLKLESALKQWPCPLENSVAIDVGASTGGFTDVLLSRGVAKVYAVDVGYGQLAEKLRVDPRVINLERTHILGLSKQALNPLPTIAVIDVSFISLQKILPHVMELLAEEATIYALVKPQFEAGREHVEKGGIVKNPQIHENVLENMRRLCEGLGLIITGIAKSPILGAKGNQEFLMAMKLPGNRKADSAV